MTGSGACLLPCFRIFPAALGAGSLTSTPGRLAFPSNLPLRSDSGAEPPGPLLGNAGQIVIGCGPADAADCLSHRFSALAPPSPAV